MKKKPKTCTDCGKPHEEPKPLCRQCQRERDEVARWQTWGPVYQ